MTLIIIFLIILHPLIIDRFVQSSKTKNTTFYCNKTAYESWYDIPYENEYIIRQLWKYLDFEKNGFDKYSFSLKKGQVMELTSIRCQESIRQLRLNLAGKHGPVSDQQIYDKMCSKFCITNDKLREEAMNYSNCNCLELSTQPEELSFHIEGDWCHMNTGRILCHELERCGVWNCNLVDFHCPRREYNTHFVPLKGYGNVCSNAILLLPLRGAWLFASLVAFILQ